MKRLTSPDAVPSASNSAVIWLPWILPSAAKDMQVEMFSNGSLIYVGLGWADSFPSQSKGGEGFSSCKL